MKAPTTRTDEAEFSFDTFNGVDPWEGERWIKVVPSKISAKIESELTAVTKERDEARGQRDKAIAMLWRLNFAVTDCYNAAFDYSNPPREQDVLPIINEVYEFLTT